MAVILAHILKVLASHGVPGRQHTIVFGLLLEVKMCWEMAYWRLSLTLLLFTVSHSYRGALVNTSCTLQPLVTTTLQSTVWRLDRELLVVLAFVMIEFRELC